MEKKPLSPGVHIHRLFSRSTAGDPPSAPWNPSRAKAKKMQTLNSPTSGSEGHQGLLSKTGSLFSSKFNASLSKIGGNRAVSTPLPQTSPQSARKASNVHSPTISNDRRSISSRASIRTHRSKAASMSTVSLTHSPETSKSPFFNALKQHPSYSTPISSRRASISRQSSYDSINPYVGSISSSFPAIDADPSLNAPVMTATQLGHLPRNDGDHAKPSSLPQLNTSVAPGVNGVTPPTPGLPSSSSSGLQNPTTIYQNIQDMSSKRISTLDYLRQA